MKIRHFIILTLIITLAFACETEFDLNEEYEDITIVYGLMERTDEGQSDTVFIKITKAFVGGDASVVSLIRDSSEYREKLDVTLTQYSESGNQLGDPFEFDTITISNKQDTTFGGDFYFPYQQLYYCVMPVNEGSRYDLRILIGDKVVTSETNIVNKFSITKPGFSQSINYIPNKDLPFDWAVSRYAKSYEAIIRFYFKEVWEGAAPGDTVYRHIDWYKTTKVNETVNIGNDIGILYSTNLFYTSVTNTVPYFDPQQEAKVVARYSGPAEYIVYAGTEELNTYANVNSGPTTSIVLDRPEFTNIDNGLGLFSSRLSVSKLKYFTNDTKDALSKLGVKFEY